MSEWWPPNKYAPTAEEDIKAARNCMYGTQILSLFPFLTSCLLDVRKRNESEYIYQMMHFCSGKCYFNDVLKCINSIIKLPSTQKCLYTKRSFSEILFHMSFLCENPFTHGFYLINTVLFVFVDVYHMAQEEEQQQQNCAMINYPAYRTHNTVFWTQ